MVNLKVENTGTEPVYFTYYTPLHWLRDFTLKDELNVTKTNPLCLKPGCAHIINKFHFILIYDAIFCSAEREFMDTINRYDYTKHYDLLLSIVRCQL